MLFVFSCSNIGSETYEWVSTSDTVPWGDAIVSYKYPDNLEKSDMSIDSTLFISFGFPVEPPPDADIASNDCRLLLIVYNQAENIDTLIKTRGTDAFACKSSNVKKEVRINNSKAWRVTFFCDDSKTIRREMIFITDKDYLYEIDASEFSSTDLDTFIQNFKILNAP